MVQPEDTDDAGERPLQVPGMFTITVFWDGKREPDVFHTDILGLLDTGLYTAEGFVMAIRRTDDEGS